MPVFEDRMTARYRESANGVTVVTSKSIPAFQFIDERRLSVVAGQQQAMMRGEAGSGSVVQRVKSPQPAPTNKQVLQRNPETGQPVRGRHLANTALRLAGHLIKGTGRILIGLGLVPIPILAPVGAITITRGVLNGLQAILEGCNLVNYSIAYFTGGDQTKVQQYIAIAIDYANKGIAKANSFLGMADLAEAALSGLLELVRLLFSALVKALRYLESRRGERQGKMSIATRILHVISRTDGWIENVKEDPIGAAIGVFEKGLEKLNEYRRRRAARAAGYTPPASYRPARPTGPVAGLPRVQSLLGGPARLPAAPYQDYRYSPPQEEDVFFFT